MISHVAVADRIVSKSQKVSGSDDIPRGGQVRSQGIELVLVELRALRQRVDERIDDLCERVDKVERTANERFDRIEKATNDHIMLDDSRFRSVEHALVELRTEIRTRREMEVEARRTSQASHAPRAPSWRKHTPLGAALTALALAISHMLMSLLGNTTPSFPTPTGPPPAAIEAPK